MYLSNKFSKFSSSLWFICLRFDDDNRDFKSKTRFDKKLIEINNVREFIELKTTNNHNEIINKVDNVREVIELKTTNNDNINVNKLIVKYENVNIDDLIKSYEMSSKIVLIFKNVIINCWLK